MHEEPLDRSRDQWIERKRRLEHDQVESRFRPSHEADSNRHSPAASHQSDMHYPEQQHRGNPRSQVPSIGHLPPSDDPEMHDEAAAGALKRRRLGDDRRRDDIASPSYLRNELPPIPSRQRYLEERDAYHDDLRSPSNGMTAQRPNGRLSPLDRAGRSPSSNLGPLPSMQDGATTSAPRPSVLSPLYDDSVDHTIPALARRRGDAAQAKAGRLHIDTSSSSALDSHSLIKGQSVAKSAPPQKLTFGNESRDQPALPYEQSQRYPHPLPSSHLSASRPDQRAVSGSRLVEHSESLRRDEREDILGLRDARMPDVPHTANPLARHAPISRLGSNYVPQTASLPSPAYHTTQFARGGGAATRNLPNPPMTARLPDHLRSPPSSKSHFLSLFSDFYDSLHDSRTMKATLEDQIRRSNTLLQTLQSSRRVLEETVDRRVREERNLWEGRVRGLEARVRELEAKPSFDSNTNNNESPRQAAPPSVDANGIDEPNDESTPMPLDLATTTTAKTEEQVDQAKEGTA